MKVVHDVLFSSAFACFVHAVTSKESLSDSSCRPPTGSTYLTIGQDLLSINEYVSEQYNASLHESSFKSTTTMSDFSPAAVMAYTDIQTLRGLFRPVDYGSGIEYADGILDSLFPGQGVGLQIGLWLNGTQGCNDINQGALDENIDRLMKYLERCHASKVFLRVGYEFDNPSFGYSGDPDAFARAFRKIVHACESSKWPCRDKVKFVWHTWAAQRAQGLSLSDFYAGDDVVDWIGVSIFQQVYPWSTVEVGRLSDLEQALEFAAAHAKPTMVAESTPFGGIDMNTSQVKALSLNDPWERWYQPTLDLIQKYDISMWSYINCNWDGQPMWHNIGFGETRLSTNQNVMRKWRRLVLGSGSSRKFLLAGSLENCGSLPPVHPSEGLSSVKLLRNNIQQDQTMDYTHGVLGATPLLWCAAVLVVCTSVLFWRGFNRNVLAVQCNHVRSAPAAYGAMNIDTQYLQNTKL